MKVPVVVVPKYMSTTEMCSLSRSLVAIALLSRAPSLFAAWPLTNPHAAAPAIRVIAMASIAPMASDAATRLRPRENFEVRAFLGLRAILSVMDLQSVSQLLGGPGGKQALRLEKRARVAIVNRGGRFQKDVSGCMNYFI